MSFFRTVQNVEPVDDERNIEPVDDERNVEPVFNEGNVDPVFNEGNVDPVIYESNLNAKLDLCPIPHFLRKSENNSSDDKKPVISRKRITFPVLHPSSMRIGQRKLTDADFEPILHDTEDQSLRSRTVNYFESLSKTQAESSKLPKLSKDEIEMCKKYSNIDSEDVDSDYDMQSVFELMPINSGNGRYEASDDSDSDSDEIYETFDKGKYATCNKACHR